MYGCSIIQKSSDVLYLQIFPRSERNFTSESICNWVFEHHENVLQWLQPPGTKSRLLERELNKGPALLLFLEHNPLGSSSNPVLQQVSRAGWIHSQVDTLLWCTPGFSLRSSDIFHLFSGGHYSLILACPRKFLWYINHDCLFFLSFRLGTLLFVIILVRTIAPT